MIACSLAFLGRLRRAVPTRHSRRNALDLRKFDSDTLDADDSARGSAKRYVTWIGDLDKGPTGSEREVNVPGDLTPFELDTCTKSIGEALKAKLE